MKHLLSLCCLLLLSSNLIFANDYLISHELKVSYSKEMLKKQWTKAKLKEFIVPINYAIDVYEIIYYTSWHDGSKIKASGLYFVPQSGVEDKHPMMCYHHGTQVRKVRKLKFKGEQAICAGFATDGYLVVRPDYIGLGLGEKTHLYQHAESEAMASRDMMRAVRELNTMLKKQENGQLFLAGYSQGGHATLATHKYLQEHHSDEFTVTASSPMSGAYDMAGVQSEVMFKPYTQPFYLPYLLLSYQEAYKFYKEDIITAFKPPYDSIMAPLFNGEKNLKQINKSLPEIPKDMLRDDLVNEFLNNPDFPFKKLLHQNNVYDWKPESPVQLCYCKGDEQVSYKNSLVAYKKMRENGSNLVKLRHAGKKFGHKKCALYACIYTKFWFDSFVNGSKKGKKGPIMKRFLIGLSKMKQ